MTTIPNTTLKNVIALTKMFTGKIVSCIPQDDDYIRRTYSYKFVNDTLYFWDEVNEEWYRFTEADVFCIFSKDTMCEEIILDAEI